MYPILTSDSEKKELRNHIPSHYIASYIAQTHPHSFSHSPEKNSGAVEIFVPLPLTLSMKLPGIPAITAT